ncbi:MAG TPA: hypothetical protein VKA89_08385 [Solirubrobacterales bacterium]|nr:hypothetical protein [Solirubrobacterales bacterium]
MSNLTQSDRNQFDRATYSGTADRIRRGSERGAAMYSLIALVIGAILIVGAASVIDGWAQWVVAGAIAATTLGFMIAVSPNRRG